MRKKKQNYYSEIDIVIETVNNGWFVHNRATGEKKVFENRNRMMEHINNMIPPMDKEQEFISALSDDECDEECVECDDEIEALFASIHPKPTKLKRKTVK